MNPMTALGLIFSLAIIVLGVMTALAHLGQWEDGVGWYTAGLAILVKILDMAVKAFRPRKVKGEPAKKNRGFARIGALVAMALLAAWLLGGCSMRMVRGDHLDVLVEKGPPCKITVKMDGDIIQKSEARKACVIKMSIEDGVI